jgi:hypothetical protein
VKTIFGREPAWYTGLIEAGLAVLVLIFFHWSSEQTALVMAVIVSVLGLYTAWGTKDTMLSVGVGLAKALFALAVGFGFHVAPDTTAALIAFSTILLGAYNRQTTEPLVARARTVLTASP